MDLILRTQACECWISRFLHGVPREPAGIPCAEERFRDRDIPRKQPTTKFRYVVWSRIAVGPWQEGSFGIEVLEPPRCTHATHRASSNARVGPHEATMPSMPFNFLAFPSYPIPAARRLRCPRP